MSAETRPISPNTFAQAIEDLPVENLYSKAFEINNSIAHLVKSNQSLQEYSDSIKNDTNLSPEVRAEGDKDCLEAIEENQIVITRQRERVQLLKAEVERRGQRWHEADPEEVKPTNGTTAQPAESDGRSIPSQTPSRLNDEELRQQLEARLADQSDDEGMHL